MIEEILNEAKRRKYIPKTVLSIEELEKIIERELQNRDSFIQFYTQYLDTILNRRIGYKQVVEQIKILSIDSIEDFNRMEYVFPKPPKFNYSKDFVPTKEVTVSNFHIKYNSLVIHSIFSIKNYKVISSINSFNVFDKLISESQKYFINLIIEKYFKPLS